MKKTTNSSPYQFEGRIPLSQAIPLGLQHVMAMFIGNLTLHRKPYTSYHCYGSMRAHSGRWLCGA